jgi:hypothetical protein
MTFVKSESPWQFKLLFFLKRRGGVEFTKRDFPLAFWEGVLFFFFIGQFGSFFFMGDPPISSHITLLHPTLSSVLQPSVSE